MPSAAAGPRPASAQTRATAAGMLPAGSARPPSASIWAASSAAGMARGLGAVTVTKPFARGSSRRSISSASLSAMMLTRNTNFSPGNSARRLSTVARIPWALWLPSSRKGGSRRSSSNRPGQRTWASPCRMALSGICQPRARRARSASMATAAFRGW